MRKCVQKHGLTYSRPSCLTAPVMSAAMFSGDNRKSEQRLAYELPRVSKTSRVIGQIGKRAGSGRSCHVQWGKQQVVRDVKRGETCKYKILINN